MRKYIKGGRCNGCAECWGCGRKYEDLEVIVCDRCGCEVNYDPVEYHGEELCNDCKYIAIMHDNFYIDGKLDVKKIKRFLESVLSAEEIAEMDDSDFADIYVLDFIEDTDLLEKFK